MTCPWIEEVERRATEFCDKRGIKLEVQRKRLFINLMEEIAEFFRARTTFEKLDALADMGIFILGAYPFTPTKCKAHNLERLNDRLFVSSLIWRIYDGESNHEIAEDVSILVYWVILGIQQLGFSPEIVFDETLKEINSRDGVYDEQLGKLKKDRSNSNSSPYKADYEKARLRNEK